MNGYQLASMVCKEYPAIKTLLANVFVVQRNFDKVDRQLQCVNVTQAP